MWSGSTTQFVFEKEVLDVIEEYRSPISLEESALRVIDGGYKWDQGV